MNVKVFSGDKDQIWTLYYNFLLKQGMAAEIRPTAKGAELRVSDDQYMHAISVGTEIIKKSHLEKIVWVNPAGQVQVVAAGVGAKVHQNDAIKMIVAFTGNSAMEIGGISSYIKREANIDSVVSMTKEGMWELVVPTNRYFQTVCIGAKVADGRRFGGVWWNDPTGQIMFDNSELARAARTEYDEVLEA